MARQYEYEVLEIRQKFLDGRGSAPTEKLQGILNDKGREGWRMRSMVTAEVAGLIGKRDGFMLILEREL